MKIHSFFIWFSAFKFLLFVSMIGNIVALYVKKEKEPLAQKLIIIQLFEGDFNVGLKYLLHGQFFM